MIDIEKLIRPNILNLLPYSSARDEFSGDALVFLDANENPFNQPFNRYPDPLQKELKKLISEIKQINEAAIFIGNGSDEPIDLLIRAFCEPGKDNIIAIDPSYGMYQVAAGINNIPVIKVPLSAEFQVLPYEILAVVNENSKLIFLCSPNNPTGNCLDNQAIIEIAEFFKGIVVLDEAYIDFIPDKSLLPVLKEHPNLVILQTLSKAWGMAGVRLGMAFADENIIGVLNKIKYPYNVNILSQLKAIELLSNLDKKNEWVEIILNEKKRVRNELDKLSFVLKVFPSDANFLLARMVDARKIYSLLMRKGIVVRDRSKALHCENCLRITVGSPPENDVLIAALNDLL